MILAGIVAAAVLVVLSGFRAGGYVLAGVLAVLGLLRLLPGSWGEMFAVRRTRLLDVATMLLLAAGIGVLASQVPGPAG
ncbi:DUF3017 domain-containing protein [Sediminivirga luteola]|uniref:DUF3017 domain-containing protein n=1 Tax=Sediminivirga luteola TaxID=1774748 RepID=A0A8J2TZ74_9MICO|nr:DUF3017 domain-containing protein [Sediminivirga luteola]MCI2266693.1 DUF3017 domain-containing protein [Sediminivirga luteola]GGA19146.1 hypothetical protein GCM10011333_22880 [Sediminivirga luteola]